MEVPGETILALGATPRPGAAGEVGAETLALAATLGLALRLVAGEVVAGKGVAGGVVPGEVGAGEVGMGEVGAEGVVGAIGERLGRDSSLAFVGVPQLVQNREVVLSLVPHLGHIGESLY